VDIGWPSAQLTRIDPVTNELAATATLGGSPGAIGFGNNAAWTTDPQQGLVWRVDRSGRVVGTYTTGAGARSPTFSDGVMWIANEDDGSVTGINAVTGAMKQHHLGHRVRGVVAGTELVAAVDVTFEDDLSLLPNGRVLTLSAPESPLPFGTPDPPNEAGPTWRQLAYTTCISLVNYPDKPAPDGLVLQPEAAAAMPVVSADGRTYTFTIRSGFRFSPPSNEVVTAETFRFSLERVLAPKLDAYFYAKEFLLGIVGAQDYTDGKAPHVAGLTASGDRLTIRLVEPDPALLWKLALSYYCPVPLGTPVGAGGGIDPDPPISSAGPYYLAKHADGYLIFRKNPNYHAGRPQPFEAIAARIGLDPGESVAKVTAGTFDAMIESLFERKVLDPQGSVAVEWGPDSDAAGRGDQRWFGAPAFSVDSLMLNPQRPPFNDVSLRRAVALALNRAFLAASRVNNTEVPTSNLLPPAEIGKEAEQPVPSPDPDAARALVKPSTAEVIFAIAPHASSGGLTNATIVADDLRAIGFKVRIIEVDQRFEEAKKPDTQISMMFVGVVEEYPDPVLVLDELMNSTGWAGDARFAELERNKLLSGAERLAAAATLAEDLSDADLLVPFGRPVNSMYFSENVACAFVQPGIAAVDLLGLCPKD
jgi:ABC-type transport system substrate-binding protein